ncbi:hypothetical protein GA0070616_4390 [Micromonospora nigra]|uniref:Uncharacterized protein n=1 Tax=Micromonospora nigra TaxID=145857 RepID=A0A1C6SRF2_9ACTN|nr:hypothetical protein [Micromonospora nigra]SCL32116.1 hypothetical protein GA0070616_4390 [Micromonospora nigra]
MSRIEINDGRRHIIVDHDGELEPLKQAALTLWEAAGAAPAGSGPATGFQLTERRWSPPVAPTLIGQYGRPPIEPVTAADSGPVVGR